MEDLVWRFWKIFSVFLLIMKRHFRILSSLFLINKHFFHKDIPHFRRYCEILHSSKKPPYTKSHCCYLLYKTTLLQQYCTTVQCEPLLKLVGVISEGKDWQYVFDCPLPPSSPARCDWEGAMGRYVKGSITNSSGTQLSSEFSFSAWPQAPFLKWIQASSCPWT